MGKQYTFYRLYYTVFAFASLGVVLIMQVTTPPYALFIRNITTIAGGIAISLFGLTIMSICILKYFIRLSGVKALIESKTKNELMITGIHRFVRHPMYSSTFIFIWGLLILFPYLSVLIADVIITVYTLIGLRFEEKKLEKEFGNAYKIYKKKVPMLIPRLG